MAIARTREVNITSPRTTLALLKKSSYFPMLGAKANKKVLLKTWVNPVTFSYEITVLQYNLLQTALLRGGTIYNIQ
jgi:hypothetical protein